MTWARAGAPFVLATVVAGGAALRAQGPDPWRHWAYAAPVQVAPVDAPRLVTVIVPAPVTAEAAPGWADLRVIDEGAREVPYILDARHSRPHRDWREARLLDPGFVPGAYSEVAIDLGPDPRVHNMVVLELGGIEDLQVSLEVAVSDDRSAWQTRARRVPITRLRRAGQGDRTEATYPASGARYLRLRIAGPTTRYVPVESARVAYEIQTPAERMPAGVALVPAPETPQGRDSVWLSEASARLPVSEVRFETGAAAFSRRVAVEVADEHERWRPIASGEIVRAPQATDRLSLEFPEATGRRWRITVPNGSDPPVPGLTPVLYTTVRRVAFQQDPGHTYRLIYGHARPEAPRYDLARLTSAEALEAAAPATLGMAVANAAFVDATPWTERHPAVIWVAMAAAILLLAVLAVRTLRGGVS